MKLLVLSCSLALWILLAAPTQGHAEARDAVPLTAEQILDRAFRTRYDVNLTSIIDLIMRNDLGQERRRRFRAMSKLIDDRVHSVGRLVEPEYLRGMTVLTIEAEDRSHDAFLYLPSLDRVRRVSTAQRGDAFFGTDVTYEDLERRRANEYDLDPVRVERIAGEDAYVLVGRPRRPYNYDEALFAVATSDFAILEVRYFKRSSEEPYRIISAPRSGMVVQDGHIVPTRMSVTNRTRGTTTEVVMSDLRINPPIEDHLFSLKALESQRRLPVKTSE